MDSWTQMATTAVALLGAVLGVINTVWAVRRDTVRIRVKPVWCRGHFPVSDGMRRKDTIISTPFRHTMRAMPEGWFAIEVTNKGIGRVTINDVGCYTSRIPPWLPWFRDRFGRYAPIAGDHIRGIEERAGTPMKSRSSEIFTPSQGVHSIRSLANARYVYARTQCGVIRFSRTGLLVEARKWARQRLSASGSGDPAA